MLLRQSRTEPEYRIRECRARGVADPGTIHSAFASAGATVFEVLHEPRTYNVNRFEYARLLTEGKSLFGQHAGAVQARASTLGPGDVISLVRNPI